MGFKLINIIPYNTIFQVKLDVKGEYVVYMEMKSFQVIEVFCL